MHPYVPLGGHMRLGVAVITYLGVLHFGFTGDHDSTTDLDVLRRGVGDGLTELLEAIPQPAPTPSQHGVVQDHL